MNKKIKKASLFALLGVSVTTAYLVATTSCSSLNSIVFGNFYSYISPNVQGRITANQPINWQYYGSNQEIPTFLQNKTLNLAISSNDMVVKLSRENAISKIDYTKFELLNNNQPVTQANQLNGLITQQAYDVATKAFRKYNINLLDYSIPYFLQNYCFAYRGPKIPELHGPNVTFQDIFNVISTNESFFKQQIMMIDDPRTVFGVSKILNDIDANKSQIDINPSKGQLGQDTKTTIEEFNNIYATLQSKINKTKSIFTLNADSNVLINKLAKNEIKGAFFYNGDAIFAGQGGDYSNDKDFVAPTADDFHIVVPKQTMIIMDSIIINSKNSEKESLESLKLAYQLSLAGLPTSKFNEFNTPYGIDPTTLDSKTLDITEEAANSTYRYIPMENFSYINYTPVIQQIYDTAIDTYFDEYGAISQIFKDTITINIDVNTIERFVEMPLTDITESNLKIAYITFKNEVKDYAR